MIRYQARWLYPGVGAPILNGEFAVEVGRFVDASNHPEIPIQSLGDVAVIPSLLNAHTHLEFSDLSEPIEPRKEFASWIQNVIQSRRSRTSSFSECITNGLAESHETGTSLVAEIATSDWIFEHSVPEQFPEVFFFREFLGLREDAVSQTLDQASRFLSQAATSGRQRVGLSPHAPYSLHPRLFRGLCDLAKEADVPVMMHLAESPAELQLLKLGTGPLVDLFSQMGLWRSDLIPRGTRPMDYLGPLAELPRVLIAHGTLLDDEEMDFVASSPQISIIYCPRTHAAMQSGVHPWEQMLKRGINVALGTDSRASNPDLSLWNELRFLKKQHSDWTASQLLQLATSNSAQALGLTDRGRIEQGYVADFCVVPLSGSAMSQPEQFLFDGQPVRWSP